jgi:hypothetical protein
MMKRCHSSFFFTWLLLAPAACSDESAKSADLPVGWDAQRIETFTQSLCTGSPYDGVPEVVNVTAAPGALHISYGSAHFRCSQSVEGFVKLGVGTADVLVQPVDMNPSSVAKCDCLYDLSMEVNVPRGTYEVTVYRRWDHKSGHDEPLEVGAQSVEVRWSDFIGPEHTSRPGKGEGSSARTSRPTPVGGEHAVRPIVERHVRCIPPGT